MAMAMEEVDPRAKGRFYRKGTRAYRRVSLALFAAGVATFAVLYCVQPLFPIFTDEMGLSPSEASLSLSVSTVMLAVSLPAAAFISDRIGRRAIMSFSLIIASLCCLCTAAAPNFTVLLCLRAVEGIVLAGLPAVAMTYLAEEMDSGSLGFAIGLYVSGTTVGGLFGRVAVSLVTELTNWRWGIGAIAIVSLLAGVYFWRTLPPSRHFKPRRQKLSFTLGLFAVQFRNYGLVCLFVLAAILMGGFVTLYNYLTFRLIAEPFRLSHALTAWIFCLYLMGTYSSFYMGRLSDRLGRPVVMWINISLMLIGGLLTLSSYLPLLIAGVAVFTFGFFGGHSTASSWVGMKASIGKAQAASLYLLFYYIGSSIGGSSGGLFWSRFGWNGVIGMIAALLLVAMLILVSFTAFAKQK
ncbi:MFS transporter [Paenibacillus silvisoli]|uniref:MFS transporter n=1 Tax=Paenibacillus silvisoli TaxID=3110539 RepID=UPI0028042821|nr:MFS transporter [Paenibacillus silvisoli]